MSEPRLILLLTMGPLLWMVGGKWWKPARRFVWPILAVCLLRRWEWRALAALATLIGSNCLPYGERTSWLKRGLVYFTLGLAGIWWQIGLSLMLAGHLALVLAGMTYLSRRYNWFTWKLVEATAGFLQAVGLVLVVTRLGG